VDPELQAGRGHVTARGRKNAEKALTTGSFFNVPESTENAELLSDKLADMLQNNIFAASKSKI
jgi:hypothetical protein